MAKVTTPQQLADDLKKRGGAKPPSDERVAAVNAAIRGNTNKPHTTATNTVLQNRLASLPTPVRTRPKQTTGFGHGGGTTAAPYYGSSPAHQSSGSIGSAQPMNLPASATRGMPNYSQPGLSGYEQRNYQTYAPMMGAGPQMNSSPRQAYPGQSAAGSLIDILSRLMGPRAPGPQWEEEGWNGPSRSDIVRSYEDAGNPSQYRPWMPDLWSLSGR